MPLDLTSTFRLKIIPTAVSRTLFNQSEESTWRSAFRETVKLSQQTNEEAQDRLYRWCNPQPGMFVAECQSGARAGLHYGEQHRDDAAALGLINDYQWLRDRFLQRS